MFCLINQIIYCRISHFVVLMTHVKTQFSFSSDHVAHARLDFNSANGCDQVLNAFRPAFDRTDPFGGRGDRIMAQIHGSGPCMVGLADECKCKPALACNYFYHPQRPAGIFKYWSLLNVELQKTGNIIGYGSAGNLFRIEAELCNGLAHRDAPRITAFQDFIVKRPYQRTTSDKRRAEANTFLFGETDNFDCKRKPSS